MYKTILILFLMVFLALPCFAVWDTSQDVLLEPPEIRRCMERPETKELSILKDNPFYLRGDFDGDLKLDYAVQVRSDKGGMGVIICTAKLSVFLLGSGISGGKPFSDNERDVFLAPNWMVYTKEQVAELEDMRGINAPWPVPKITGEAIAMIWEDGIALIYWDGKEFKWAGIDPDKR